MDYDALKALVLEGASDEAALQWCFDHGRTLSDEDILIFNSFMSKRGYRDDQCGGHNERVRKEYGMDGRTDIEPDFDLIEADEGRPVDAWKDAWGVS